MYVNTVVKYLHPPSSLCVHETKKEREREREWEEGYVTCHTCFISNPVILTERPTRLCSS